MSELLLGPGGKGGGGLFAVSKGRLWTCAHLRLCCHDLPGAITIPASFV